NDGRLAPAPVAAFQCRTHQLDVADTLEGAVHTTVGPGDDHPLARLVAILGVDEVGSTQPPGAVAPGPVDIHADDAAGTGHPGTDARRQTDAAQTEDGHRGAGFHLGGIEHRADTGGDPATEQANLFQRRIFLDLGHRHFRYHRVFGEGGAAHVVVDRL